MPDHGQRDADLVMMCVVQSVVFGTYIATAVVLRGAALAEKDRTSPPTPGRASVEPILCVTSLLKVVRDPEWEGVVDGEVCGLGPLAGSVRTFLHWVPIKLEARETLRLGVSCGDALAREVIQ